MADSAYYEDFRSWYRRVGETNSFAEFLRKLILEQLEDETLEKADRDEHDGAFLNAVDDFLRNEQVEPILWPEEKKLPKDLARALHRLLSGKCLNAQPHVFNTGADAEERGEFVAKQRRVAALFEAASDYYYARNPNRETDKHFKIWKREVALKDGQYVTAGLKEVDHIDFSNPVILRVPGISSKHDQKAHLEGVVQALEQTLGGEEWLYNASDAPKISIYMMSYPYKNELDFAAETHRQNAQDESPEDELAAQFVQEVLLPSFDLAQGRKRSVGELKSIFRKLTLFSDSYGSVTVQRLRTELVKALVQDLGYAQEEVKQALPAIYHQSIFPTAKIEEDVLESGSFSNFYVISHNDLTARSRTSFKQFLPEKAPRECEVRVNAHSKIRFVDAPLEGISLTAKRLNSVAANESEEDLNALFKLPKSELHKGHDPGLALHDLELDGRVTYNNALTRQAFWQGVNRSETQPDPVSEDWGERVQQHGAGTSQKRG